MGDTRDSLLDVFDFAWERLRTRVAGLSDEEYFWEPVDDAWSIRKSDSGLWTMDRESGPDGPPLTTIAWRTCHLGGQVLGGFAKWFVGGGSPYNVEFTIPDDAATAITFLKRNFQNWRRGVVAFPEQRLWVPIGPEFGPFEDSSAVDLILHVLDEFIHHAAEIALLRDLYSKLG